MKVVRGETPTLHTGVKDYRKIFWRNGHNVNIADCQVQKDDSTLCSSHRDGLQIDRQTGSLTFMNISDKLGGHYKLQIFSNSFEKSTKEFNVSVFDPLPFPTIYVSENSSCSQCVLQCSANVTQATLSWYKGNHFLSSIHISDPNNSISLPLKGNYEDINEYRCVVNNSISNQTKHLSRSEVCRPCAETGLKPVYIVLICLVIAVIGFLGTAGAVIYCSKGRRQQTGTDYSHVTKTEEQSPGESAETSSSGDSL